MRMSITALLAGAVLLAAVPAESQQLGVTAGYVRMPGPIGDSRSDHGIAARLGMHLGARRLIGLRFEVGVDRLNEDFSESSNPSCVLPGGGTGACFFRSWTRDVGFSANALATIQARTGKAAPYLLVGLGGLSVRTHQRVEARDAGGNRLPNFEFDGSYTDGALLGHLGGGVAISPGRGRLALTLEGRATAVLHNYSGGFAMDTSPSIVVGVRW
jgi:hypothetical protein